LFFSFSIVGNFFVDVNFTEIEGDPNSVNMIVKVNAAPNTEPSRYIREKLLGIYLLNLPNCDGLDISTLQPARLLSPLNKGDNFQYIVWRYEFFMNKLFPKLVQLSFPKNIFPYAFSLTIMERLSKVG